METLDQAAPSARGRLLRWSGRVLLSLAVGAVLTFAALYVGLHALGYRFYEVRSGSMEPALEKGTVVAVKEKPAQEIAVGDTVAYMTQNGVVIIHRVVGIESDPDLRSIFKDREGNVIKEKMTWSPRTFTTQGDANPEPDPYDVKQGSVIGTERFVVPAALSAVITSMERSTFFLLGVGCIALFIAWESVEALRRRARTKAAPSAHTPAAEGTAR